ncbi:MAG: hypothetical protein JW902_09680, partial [Syntrophaceae bacterium]|nr:hypothetical protein [Syntrophaceae bacterium]
FQQIVARQANKTLLISDEVHNAGAKEFRGSVNEDVPFRLGLSATPERRYDDSGNLFIKGYFGETVYEFDLKDAIKAGVLTRYRYYPVLVNLVEKEQEIYLDLTARIGRLFAQGTGNEEDDGPSENLKRLLIQRARLIANAKAKLPALVKLLNEREEPLKSGLVYCGDGSVESASSQETMRQVSEVCRLLGEELGLRVRQYTAEEPPEERSVILSDFEQGYLDAVVAIRCLDEGVDLPVAETGFLLASSSNPRQYVQRRGRLLRRAPGKNFSFIYDLIIVPPDLGGSESDAMFNVERRLFRKELARICEFCETADNGETALDTLLPLRTRYNLLAGVKA